MTLKAILICSLKVTFLALIPPETLYEFANMARRSEVGELLVKAGKLSDVSLIEMSTE